MDLTIIIPVHNHWQTTATCLISVLKNKIPCNYKIIIIDDASTDRTQTLLDHLIKGEYPVKVVKNEVNLGYLPSVNNALKTVDTTHILLLNNDTFLDKNCISELLKNYNKYPDIGVLGATQYDSDWKELVPLKFFARGKNATITDHIVPTTIPKNLKESEVIYCDDVHFACALLSKKIIDEIGLLDEQFGKGNYEQEDFCLRVKEAKYQVAICPPAKFIHYGGVSTADKFVEYYHLLNRNRQLFFDKWGKKLRKNEI